MRENGGKAVSDELQRALADLLEVGWQSIVAYRAAADVVRHPRIEAALNRLRLDHERHVQELEAVLAQRRHHPEVERARAGPSNDQGAGDTKEDARANENDVEAGTRIAELSGVWQEVRCAVGDQAVLDALRRAERTMESAYAAHTRRGHIEPVGAMLRRHWREEEAHVNWLHESTLWRGIDAHEDVRTEPPAWSEIEDPRAPEQSLDSEPPSRPMGPGA